MFVVQPFKRQAAVDTKKAYCMLDELLVSLNLIFDKRSVEVSFSPTYALAFELNLNRHGEKLYAALQSLFEERARTKIDLSEFKRAAEMTQDLCIYMDKTFVVTNRLLTTFELAMCIYTKARAEMRRAALGHWRRHASLVGGFALHLRRVFIEVTFRPQNSGAKRSRDEFEGIASDYNGADPTRDDLKVRQLAECIKRARGASP